MFSKVLFLSHHTDDVELSAGGTIARFVEEQKDVYVGVFSHAEKSIKGSLPKKILLDESKKSLTLLGVPFSNVHYFDFEVRNFSKDRQEILEDLIRLRDEVQPDLVFLPSTSDVHQEHHPIQMEGLRAFKPFSSIFGYEHPWNNLTFTTDVFINLSQAHVDKKIQALNCYESQRDKPYFNPDYVTSLTKVRGNQIGVAYAEAFELIRLLIK